MAIGKVGSFGTDAPLREDYIGNALSEVENQGFRYKAEKRLEDEKKKAEEDAKLRELSEWNKSVKADVTGYGSIDLPIKEYLMRIKQEGGNLTQKMMNPSLPFTERVKLMGERDAMVSGIDYLKQIPTLLNSTLSEIHEGVKSGKYDADSEDQALKTIKAISQGDFKIDPSSGNPVVTVWERDKKGNPIRIIADKQNFGDFMKENLTPELKSDYRGIVAKFHKEYVPDRTVTVDADGREIVDQRVKMEKGSKDYLNAQENAKAILMQPQERKAVAKIAGLSPDNYEGLLDYATTDLLRGVKSEYENKQDPNLALARQKEAREARGKEEPIRPTIGDYRSPIVIQPEDEEKGKNIVRPLERVYKKNLGFKKDEFKLQSVGGKYNNVAVETIGLNSKGVPFITGTYAIQKGSSDGVSGISKITQGAKEKRFFYDLGHTELNSVAQRLGYENGDALTYELRRMNNYKAKTQNTPQAKPKPKPNNNDPLGIL